MRSTGSDAVATRERDDQQAPGVMHCALAGAVRCGMDRRSVAESVERGLGKGLFRGALHVCRFVILIGLD